MSKRKFVEVDFEEKSLETTFEEFYQKNKSTRKNPIQTWISQCSMKEPCIVVYMTENDIAPVIKSGFDDIPCMLYYYKSQTYEKILSKDLFQMIIPSSVQNGYDSCFNTMKSAFRDFFQCMNFFCIWFMPLLSEELSESVECDVLFGLSSHEFSKIAARIPSDFEILSSACASYHRFLFSIVSMLSPPSHQHYLQHRFDQNDKFSNFKLELWPAQKRNLTWMAEMENCRSEFKFRIGERVPISNTCLVFSSNGISFNKENSSYVTHKSTHINSGMICDPTGTGKSITIIGHIYNQLGQKNLKYHFDRLVFPSEFFYSEATLIVCPKYLIKQWEENLKKCLGSKIRKPSSSKKNDEVRVFVVKTVNDINKQTIDILTSKSDIVLLNKEVLGSNSYLRLRYEDHTMIATYKQNYKNHSKAKNFVQSCHANKIGVDKIDCIFEYVWWSRIIYEELHEIGNSNNRATNEGMKHLSGNFHWGITATPPSGENSNFNFYDISEILLGIRKVYIKDYPTIIAQYTQNFTTRSGQIDFKVEHKKVAVQFSPQEMSLYHSSASTESFKSLLKFCCHHTLEQYKLTLEEACAQVTESDKKKIEKNQIDLKKITEDRAGLIQTLKQILNSSNELPYSAIPQLSNLASDSFYDDKILKKISKKARALLVDTNVEPNQSNESRILKLKQLDNNFNNLLKLNRNISHLEDAVSSTRAHLTFFENTFKILSTDEPCKCYICLQDVEFESTPILPCGHIFHTQCVLEWLPNSETCPQCRFPISKDDFKIINRLNSRDTQPPSLYGSKIDKMVQLIQAIIVNKNRGKIIIYAQWNHFIDIISKALEEYKLDTVRIKGSILQCENSIAKFKTSKTHNIILLSSDDTLSGLDLPEASDIILAHPLYGYENGKYSYKSVYKNQQQAIGRTLRIGQTRHVRVHHMIVEGTIENKLYEEQMTFSRSQKDFIDVPE